VLISSNPRYIIELHHGKLIGHFAGMLQDVSAPTFQREWAPYHSLAAASDLLLVGNMTSGIGRANAIQNSDLPFRMLPCFQAQFFRRTNRLPPGHASVGLTFRVLAHRRQPADVRVFQTLRSADRLWMLAEEADRISNILTARFRAGRNTSNDRHAERPGAALACRDGADYWARHIHSSDNETPTAVIYRFDRAGRFGERDTILLLRVEKVNRGGMGQ